MKKLNAFFLLVLSTGFALGAEPFSPNISQGHLFVGGSATLDAVLNNPNQFSTFDVSTGIQYLVMDRFGIGGVFSYDHTSAPTDTVLLGPALHYFFWTEDRLAAYVSTAFSFGLTDHTITGRWDGSVGLDYFFTPAVALGPWVTYRHVIGRYGPSYDRILAGLSFGLYL